MRLILIRVSSGARAALPRRPNGTGRRPASSRTANRITRTTSSRAMVNGCTPIFRPRVISSGRKTSFHITHGSTDKSGTRQPRTRSILPVSLRSTGFRVRQMIPHLASGHSSEWKDARPMTSSCATLSTITSTAPRQILPSGPISIGQSQSRRPWIKPGNPIPASSISSIRICIGLSPTWPHRRSTRWSVSPAIARTGDWPPWQVSICRAAIPSGSSTNWALEFLPWLS